VDEQALVLRVRAGDVTALAEVFRAHYASMCSFVQLQVGSADTAEDLVQDVFVRVWDARERLDINGSLRNLLYRSAHNAAINHLKRRTIEHRWVQTAAAARSNFDATEDPAALAELETAIDSALARLPERCRLIFTLSRHHGFTYAEIADTLDLSIKTVETQMGRALKSLRSQLSAFLP
jgi:RNA polymerase sigma-70 factor, ECF subfamily